MGSFWQNVNYGLRMLAKQPAVTVVAIVALALGIGANTAIFSAVNAVLLRPLPYEKPDRLVLLNGAPTFIDRSEKGPDRFMKASEWFEWKDQVSSFESLAAYGGFAGGLNLTGAGEPERVQATEVTTNFFSTIGAQPIHGRGFTIDEYEPGKSHVVVLGHGFWQRRFGGDPSVVGQTLLLDGKTFTVVGIAPRGLQYPAGADLWLPIDGSDDRVLSASVLFYNVIGRLKDGATIEQAQADMEWLANWANEQSSKPAETPHKISVIPLEQHLVKDIKPALLILLGAVAFVLLIACINVANLLLARAASRQRELAIRAALGATRWHLLRQLLTESVLLSLIGGALGLLVAMWSVDSLVALIPTEIPRLNNIRLDGQVLGFTLVTSVLTGILFGLLPALHGSKVNLNEALKEGDRRTVAGGLRRARGGLVVAEVALALVLMIGAGLLIKSFVRLQAVDPGFEADNALTVALALPNSKYEGVQKRTAFYQAAIERLQNLPGVEAVGATNSVPFSGREAMGFAFKIEGKPVPEKIEEKIAAYIVVSAGYFQGLNIPLLEGRTFTDADTRDAQPVVIINETLARRHWPDESPIGKRLTLPGDKQPREVVGVAASVKRSALDETGGQDTYVPYRQSFIALTTLIIRTESDPSTLVGAVQGEMRSLDPDLPLYDIKTMKERISESTAKRRFTLLLLGLFAAIAMLLAAIGIYGVISYSVAQRTHEIGIRMALGGQAGDMLRLVLKQGMTLALVGVAIGLVAAFALTRLIESFLFNVSATDAATFAIVSVILTGVALVACAVPARRATKVDPMEALRYE